MSDHPTPDPIGQDTPGPSYVVDLNNGDTITLEIHGLATPRQVGQILKAVRDITGTRLPAGAEWFVDTSRSGRRPGQRTRITPEQEREITAYVQARYDRRDRWEDIIADIKERYPEDEYERTWNERTLRRWIGPRSGQKPDTNRPRS